MSIQSTIKEAEDNFGQQFADYGGEYSSNIDAPRSMLLEYIKTSQLNLLKAVVGEMASTFQKEIDYVSPPYQEENPVYIAQLKCEEKIAKKTSYYDLLFS